MAAGVGDLQDHPQAQQFGEDLGEHRRELRLHDDRRRLRVVDYRSEEFKPSLTFHVGRGWSSSPLPEASDSLGIARGQLEGLGFANVQDVYKPTRTGSQNVVDAPKDMVEWFQQHPYLQTSKPEPVRVGGVKGLQFEVVLGDLPQNYNGGCSSIVGHRNCVDLFSLSTGGPVFVAEVEKVRRHRLGGGEGRDGADWLL